MPSYNQAAYIDEAIQSVINQRYGNLELIIIDGGSTDGTIDVIRRHEDAIAYWVSEPDKGQSDALNKALARATGEIIGWINSDDMYLPWTFEVALEALERDKKLGLVFGSRLLIGSSSEVLGFVMAEPFVPSSCFYPINSETVFWRREVNRRIGGFRAELNFAIDFDFFSRAFKEFPSRALPEFMGCFRCHDESKSATMFDTCITETAALAFEHFGIDWREPDHAKRVPRYSYSRLGLYPYTCVAPYLRRRFLSRREGRLDSPS